MTRSKPKTRSRTKITARTMTTTRVIARNRTRIKTCSDAVKVSGRQVVNPASLELKGTGAVDGWDRGVGLLHPVHQPLDLTVAAEGISSEVPARNTKNTKVLHVLTPEEPSTTCHLQVSEDVQLLEEVPGQLLQVVVRQGPDRGRRQGEKKKSRRSITWWVSVTVFLLINY